MAIETIKVPDIGGAENVDVIELCVAVGDTLNAEDSLIVLESDKASMDIPSPKSGKVVKFLVKEGDQVSEGTEIAEVETEASGDASNGQAPDEKPQNVAPATEQRDIPVAVPDIGGADGVEVIEVSVSVGDEVQEGDSLIVLESDKASMDIPSPASGKVTSIAVKEGDKVSEGSTILMLSSAADEAAQSGASAPEAAAAGPEPVSSSESDSSGGVIDLVVPDIGGAEDVEVIEVCVSEGDEVNEGDSLIVLESDKASMEIPSPTSGKIATISIKEGSKASKGTAIGTLKTSGAAPAKQEAAAPEKTQPAANGSAPVASESQQREPAAPTANSTQSSADVYAGPAVRKLAR